MPSHWVDVLDWRVGLARWTGALDWRVGLARWTGALDWRVGRTALMDDYARPLPRDPDLVRNSAEKHAGSWRNS
jgi:hypothetical protein